MINLNIIISVNFLREGGLIHFIIKDQFEHYTSHEICKHQYFRKKTYIRVTYSFGLLSNGGELA